MPFGVGWLAAFEYVITLHLVDWEERPDGVGVIMEDEVLKNGTKHTMRVNSPRRHDSIGLKDLIKNVITGYRTLRSVVRLSLTGSHQSLSNYHNEDYPTLGYLHTKAPLMLRPSFTFVSFNSLPFSGKNI